MWYNVLDMEQVTVYATSASKKELEKRLEAMIAKRGEVAAMIKEAREFGDLKENAEYAAAREAQNNLETEINEITAMIPNIKLFSYAKAPTDVVGLGSKVTVEVKGNKMDFVITGILDSDIEKGYVSNVSPIGSALIGQKKGAQVEVKVPAGKTVYKILKIAAGE